MNKDNLTVLWEDLESLGKLFKKVSDDIEETGISRTEADKIIDFLSNLQCNISGKEQ